MFCPKCAAKCIAQSVDGTERDVCPDCGFISFRNPYPAVSVLTVQDDEVALGKRHRDKTTMYPDKWCLPCGYIEYGEDYVSAAIRETKEEIGIDIAPLGIINVVSNRFYEKISSLVIVLLARPLSMKLLAGDDIAEAKWFDIGNLPELTFDADRFIIERYAQHRTRIEEMPIICLADTLNSVSQS